MAFWDDHNHQFNFLHRHQSMEFMCWNTLELIVPLPQERMELLGLQDRQVDEVQVWHCLLSRYHIRRERIWNRIWMNLQRLRHEILDFVTALFMGNLPFDGHSTVYYRPEDCYTGPFTLCKAVHSPLHCLRCVCVKHFICVWRGERLLLWKGYKWAGIRSCSGLLSATFLFWVLGKG